MLFQILGVLWVATPLLCEAANAEQTWREARSSIREWVRTEDRISAEKSQWTAEKEVLKQSIDLLETEREQLAGQIKKARSRASEKISEQKELKKALAAQERVSKVIRSRLVQWEAKIRKLRSRFPPPLKKEVATAMARLPKDSEKTEATLAERVRHLIGILKAVNEFHSGIAVTDGVRRNKENEKVRVQVLYVGLGQGYFVDKSGELAGWGMPRADGWEWHRRAELGPTIQRAIDIYEKQETPGFLGLPAKVN